MQTLMETSASWHIELTKQSFMNFNEWRNGEELDLIVVFKR